MDPRELHWLMAAKQPVKMFGSMTEAEVDEIYREAYGDDEE